MLKRRLNVIFEGRVCLIGRSGSESYEWRQTLNESCFQIELLATPVDEDATRVTMRCAPCTDDSYELLIDYQLQVDDSKHFVEFDKWDASRELIDVRCPSRDFDLVLFVNVREILSPQNLTVSTSFRNFHILTFDKSFYVNTAQLKELGGRLFDDWYDREGQSETSAVVQSMSGEELGDLLQAVCSYTTPIVHRHNFERLLEMARRWGINGVLRRVECFLIERTALHPIRKLEYAAEFRMARLADCVLRSFPTRLSRLECLFEYLADNGESLDDMHLDVLDMCEIFEDCVIS